MRLRERKDGFWKAYFIYAAILILLLGMLYVYVRGQLTSFENNAPEKQVIALIKKGGAGALWDFVSDNCLSGPYGDSRARKEYYLSTGESARLEAKVGAQPDLEHYVLNVSADGKPFLRVVLKESGSRTVLGIMTIADWEVESCIIRDPLSEEGSLPLAEDGSLAYTLDIPEGFTPLIDGVAFEIDPAAEKVVLPDFEYVAPFAKVPSGIKINIEGLYFEPRLSALNNAGREVAAEKKSPSSYSVPADYAETEEAKAAASGLDPLYIGKLWSKFMTDDVGGAGRGLYTVRKECRLLEGTNLYRLATRWAGSIDITFVSGHSISGWTNEKVFNYVLYNDKLFSCDVYFEKNLRLSTGADRTDVFHNRMYFVYISDPATAEPGWYLADMHSLTGTMD